MIDDIRRMSPSSGRLVGEDNKTVNVADIIRDGLVLAASNIRDVESVTPTDATDLPLVATYGAARALYVGGAGDVTIRMEGKTIPFVGLLAGSWYPMPPFLGVEALGTTASSIIAGY